MRAHLPSSRGYFRPGFSIFDTFWAALSPLLALYVRGAYILSADGAATAALYCGISFVFALIAFLAFRLNDALSRYFSVHDVLNILKASSVAGLMTAVVLFTFTRLEGIPRSTPIIYVFILASGLITARALALLRDSTNNVPIDEIRPPSEHISHDRGKSSFGAVYQACPFVLSQSPSRHCGSSTTKFRCSDAALSACRSFRPLRILSAPLRNSRSMACASTGSLSAATMLCYRKTLWQKSSASAIDTILNCSSCLICSG